MIKLNEKNIEELVNDKEKFLNYAKEIRNTFNGPSSYFYLKVIDRVRNTDYKELFLDNNFIEYLYATLTSWGMHRMDNNTRMADFEVFKGSIVQNKEKFIKLSERKLRDVNIEEIKEDLLKIFRNLKIMDRDSAPKLVAHSKIMHFLIPDLVPPMDKGNIIFFFYGSWKITKRGKKYKYTPLIKDEEEIFVEVMKQFQNIANKLNLGKRDLISEWDTSIPKLIDNAIIGYNKHEEKN